MLGGERAQVLDEVTSLLDKHLLYQGEQGDHSPRLLLHETIREYGLEALVATQELEMARQVHAEYYLPRSEPSQNTFNCRCLIMLSVLDSHRR